MSLSVGELQVILSGDTRKLNRDLDRIDARAGQTERTHSAAWSRIGTIAGAAVKAGAVVATAAVAGLGVAIKKGLDLASFQEQAQISFATLLGGADKARAYLGDLQQFAAATPFELPGVVQAAQQLLGVGRSAESVIPTLTAWGNASGALGQTQEQFGRTMTAVTQMIGKGKVSAEEMMQITEAGIPIWGLMAEATGKPIAELQKLASEGKLLADDVLPLLERQMQKNYGGAMEAQAKTLSGVWSTAKDNLNLALADGVKPLAAGLTVLLPTASEKAAEAIRNLGQRGSQGLVDLIKRGQELREEFGPELSRIADMARQKWDQFVDVAKRLGAELAPSLPSVADALLRIAEVGMDVGAGMLPVLRAAIAAVGPVSEAVAGSLQIVATTLEAIEPILPVVLTGFLAFRGISAVNGLLTGFAGGVKDLSERMSTGAINAGVFTEKLTRSAGAGEKVMTGMGKAAGAISKVGSALPVVGLAVAAVGYVFEKHAQQVEADTQALLENLRAQDQGGQASNNGTKALEEHRKKIREAEEAYKAAAAAANTGLGATEGYATGVAIAGTRVERLKDELDNANKAYQAELALMNPLEQAQQKVAEATENMLQAQKDFGEDSPQYAAAADALAAAQGRLETQQRGVATATQTATDKLLAQAQAAVAGANADLAASMAQTSLTTATETYNASLADGTLTATQRTQAGDAMTQQAYNTAQALAAQAFAHSTAATDELKQVEADAALLASLQATAQQLGVNTPKAITDLIASLQKSSAAAATSKTRMEELGLSVVQIPNNKSVIINAPTDKQKKDLENLGYTVTNIPGSKNVVVTADTSPASAALAALVARNYTINVRATMPDLNGAVSGSGRMGSYDSGGYTGNGGKYDVAGIVHKAEFVVDKEKTARFRPLLEAIHAGRDVGRQFLPGAGSAGSGVAGDGGLGGPGRQQPTAQNVTNRIYTWNGTTREEMSLRHFIDLQGQYEALYG